MADRISRALNERIYLLKAEQGVGDTTQDIWNFEVKGQSNKVYKVKIVRGGASACTCMDYVLRRKLCKHLIFITERVARLTNVTHRMLGNNNLSDDDFQSLNESLKKRLVRDNSGEDCTNLAGSTEDPSSKMDRTTDDCSICFDSLQGETLLQCVTTCKNYFHEACLKIWLSKNKSCPLCRAQWVDKIRDPDARDDALDYLERLTLKPTIKLILRGDRGSNDAIAPVLVS